MKMAVFFEADREHPSLYTIEEIFGNKANSTIRMYAIKIVSNFFQSMKSCHEETDSFKAPQTFNSTESFLADNLPVVVHYFF